MQVKEIMSRQPLVCPENTTLTQAALEMQKHDFGFLPVSREGKLIGAVTDRDLTIRALSKGCDPNKATIKEVMTNKICYCHETDDIHQAVNIMSKEQINRLAVYDKQDVLTGILSSGDIARKCNDTSLCGKLSEAIHRP